MSRSIIEFFSNKSIGFKFTVVFLSVILVPMLLLAYISYRVIDSRLIEHARNEVTTGLKSAWTEYYVRGEQMRYGMLQAASMEEIRRAVAAGDGEYLKKMMAGWQQMRPYVDLWAVVDKDGKVIARVDSDHTGDTLSLNGFVAHVIAKGEPQISTEILGEDALKNGGQGLHEKVLSMHSGKSFAPGPAEMSVLALTVVTPVLDKNNRPVGAIVTGDVLNNDSFVPDMVAYKMPGLFTTISAKGVRVSTNITDTEGRNARGTRIDRAAADALLSGNPAFMEWQIPGLTVISRFEPIKDFRGAIIGSIDVGISKEKTWEIQRRNQQVIAVFTLLGLSFSLLAALVSTYKITRPLKVLTNKLSDYAHGDLEARIELPPNDSGSGDELSILARAFNGMMDEVGRKELEKEKHRNEIEQKNIALAELNDELRITNEELEVAYEETQSQTEELHAINEELKLLNEDLDRKNIELQNANRIITKEEHELKKARNKLRLIYDSIRDYILLVGYDSAILEANRFFLEKTGMDESIALGKSVYSAFGMEQPSLRDCPVRRSIDTMSPCELETTSAEGKVLVWQSYPIIGAGEEPRSAVLYIQDITEKRLHTQKLIQTDKLSSLGELVSGVAHELNNPLTGIMCFSELLLEERLGESANSKLRKINDASHRCKKIIENLLTFARWKKPEKQFEDVNRIIKDSIEFRQYQLKMDNINVELDLDESVPGTMCDATQMQQVFLNLITNARDAIREGGLSGGRIRISSRHAGGRIIVSIEDSGKGISEDVVNRIFDPFFTTKDVGKGTGLGLSISYGIVHEHGGNIYASSKPGTGTTFVVDLPVLERAEPEMNEAPCGFGFECRVDGKGLKALILDDEPIILDLLNDSLTKLGFGVEKCSSAEEALKKISDERYDLIVSDVKMPGIGGKGFYREVERVRPEILKKIVFISGDSMSKETQNFLLEVGNPSLKKPFTIDQLNEIVSRLML